MEDLLHFGIGIMEMAGEDESVGPGQRLVLEIDVISELLVLGALEEVEHIALLEEGGAAQNEKRMQLILNNDIVLHGKRVLEARNCRT